MEHGDFSWWRVPWNIVIAKIAIYSGFTYEHSDFYGYVSLPESTRKISMSWRCHAEWVCSFRKIYEVLFFQRSIQHMALQVLDLPSRHCSWEKWQSHVNNWRRVPYLWTTPLRQSMLANGFGLKRSPKQTQELLQEQTMSGDCRNICNGSENKQPALLARSLHNFTNFCGCVERTRNWST